MCLAEADSMSCKGVPSLDALLLIDLSHLVRMNMIKYNQHFIHFSVQV